MRYEPMPAAVFRRHRERLMAELPAGAMAIVHSSDVPPLSGDGVLPFHQSSDLHYLTGIDQEETILVLFPGAPHPEDREVLFVRETSDEIRIWEGPKLTQSEAAMRSGVARVEWNHAFPSRLRRWMRQTDQIFLNANEHPRAAREVATRSDRFRGWLQERHPAHRYERLSPVLTGLRERKGEEELALIRQACEITGRGFRRVLQFMRPGVREFEVEAEWAHEFLRRGSSGFAYTPIIASGANACALHYIANDGVCRDAELVLMDVGAEYGHYNADLTRTVPVNGRFTERQRAVYEAVLRVMRACMESLLRPGKTIKAYHAEVGRLVEEELLTLGLLDAGEVAEERARDGSGDELAEENRAYRRYFMHGTSHSLGLDVHDVQRHGRETEIEAGMVFTVEPGIYLPGEGMGIRLENDVVVGETGNIDLMAGVPLEPEEIEEAMAERG